MGVVTLSRTIARHQDQRRGVRRLKAECEIQQDERVRVPVSKEGEQIKCDPHDDDHRLDHDERPRSHRADNIIREPLA